MSGLKSYLPSRAHRLLEVSPYTGEWIEIADPTADTKKELMSHLTQVSGLKFDKLAPLFQSQTSHLTQVSGLKFKFLSTSLNG